MRTHFKRFFRSMAQKDLLLSDACLPLCGRSLLFFCRRFLFQIKRKCRNAGSIYHLIIVHSEGKKDFCEDFVPLSRQRCVEVAAPYRLRLIDYKSPFTNLFCHIMQLYIFKKSRQTLLSGLFAVL